jgi:hypothetical protein
VKQALDRIPTFKEWVEKANEEHRKKVESLRWGDWVYDRELMTLTNLKYDYEIDLEEISDIAEILDWIFQVFGKEWDEHHEHTVYCLLEAFRDLLNPQANYCSWGKGRSYPSRLAIEGFLKP